MKLFTCSLLFLSVAFGQNCADVVTPNPPSAALTAAISSLMTAGADVKVHIVETIPAQLELWEKSIESACAWTSLDGARKNSLISVVVATKSRKTGIYFGHVWDSALRDTWNSIQATAMNPHFRDGDYDAGVSAGLQQIANAIKSSRSTSASSPPAAVLPAAQPIDLSGAWDGFLLIVLLIGGAFLLGFVWFMWKQWRARKDARLGAQQKALIAQEEASRLVAEVQGGDVAFNALSDAAMKARLDSVIQTFSLLGRGASDPSLPGLTEEQYRSIGERFLSVSEQIRSLSEKQMPTAPFFPVSHEGRSSHGHKASTPHIVEPEPIHDHYRYTPPPPAYYPASSTNVVIIEDSQRYTPPAPEPEHHSSWSSPSSDDGGSSSWGSSSSSDSGGSSDFGSSDYSGPSGGGDSSW